MTTIREDNLFVIKFSNGLMIQCWKIQNKDFVFRQTSKLFCDLVLKYSFKDKNFFTSYSEWYHGNGRHIMQIAPISENKITLYSDEPFDKYDFSQTYYSGIFLTLMGFWK